MCSSGRACARKQVDRAVRQIFGRKHPQQHALGVEINAPSDIVTADARAAQPRSIGEVRVSTLRDGCGIARLGDLRQSGALKLLFPRTQRTAIEAVLVNTAGGLTGGDRFRFSAEVGAGTSLTVTTQAAERAYRSQASEIAHVENRLSVAEGGRLNWLPQETILFEKSALQRRLRIDLSQGSRLLMVEPLVFGRAAMGETLRQVLFSDRIRITREGRPLYFDGVEIDGDANALMARPATGAGAGAMVNLVYVGPDAPAHLEAVRNELPVTGGASLREDDMLVLRALAPDSFLLRRALLPILDLLTDGGLPSVWRI